MRHVVLGLAVVSAFSACTFGDGEPRVVSADEPLPEDLVAGDVVRKGDLDVVVPEPGEHVVLTAELVDGSSIELSIRNPLDGFVEVIAPPASEPNTIEAALGACDDGAYNLSGHKWLDTYQWRFQAGSTPAANSKDNVETALVRAANTITTSRNNCGLADLVSATHQYLGRTSTAPNISGTTTTVSCGNSNGVNSVGFGKLPAGFLAVACTWTAGNGNAFEGDVKYNTRHSWYALDVPGSCSNRYGVAAVGAHEFGHVFGLGHVSESKHPNLTMSTAARACSNAPVTLGRGDVRALRALY